MRLFVVLSVASFCLAAGAAEFSADRQTAGLWHFNEKQGDTAYDASAAGVHLVRQGGAWTKGIYGNAVQLAGGQDFLAYTDPPEILKPAGEVTVEAWIKADSGTPNDGEILSLGNAYGLRLLADGNVRFFYFDGTTWPALNTTGLNRKDGQWHYLAGVKDRQGLRIYLDGKLAAEMASPGKISYTKGRMLYIGRYANDNTRGFQGSLDEVRISTAARSAMEIARTLGLK